MSVCAACGKTGDNLKICTACNLVKYCNRDCQISHRSKHKKECRKRAAELQRAGDDNTSMSNVNKISEGISNVSISGSISGSTDKKMDTSYEQNSISDEELFQDPPPKEDCPICMLPMPVHIGICGVGMMYQVCCGKVLCCGCVLAAHEEVDKGKMKDLCAFCRMPTVYSDEEYLKRLEKRLMLNDREAFYQLACAYRDGDLGLSKDNNKALELMDRAADLGSPTASYILAQAYYIGQLGVEKDLKKENHYLELAAMSGHEIARHNLGGTEAENSNMYRAMKHYLIAARRGYDDSMKAVGDGYKDGYVTKDQYANTLRVYQSSCKEMKSEQRTKAAPDLFE